MTRNKLWLIDENQDQLKTSAALLHIILPEIQIMQRLPFPLMPDYIALMLNDSETACVMVDQKLKDTGIALYFGIELAQYLRAIDQKLPIYILTNYVDEKEQFEEGQWSVEDIIDKHQISDVNSDYVRTFKARLLRRMDTYGDVLAERQRRFQELLRKSLTSELSSEDIQELQELQGIRGAAIAANEAELLSRVENTLREYQEKLGRFGLVDE